MDGQGGRGGRHLDADSGLNPWERLPPWKIGCAADKFDDKVIDLDATGRVGNESAILVEQFHCKAIQMFYRMNKLCNLIVGVSECIQYI